LSSSPPVVDAASDIARQNVAASSAASRSPCALVSAVLRLVASAEQGSEHPLATAIVRAAPLVAIVIALRGGCFRRVRAPAEVSSVPHRTSASAADRPASPAADPTQFTVPRRPWIVAGESPW
jgi:hypothetical protein